MSDKLFVVVFFGWVTGLISRVAGTSLFKYMMLGALVGAIIGVIGGLVINSSTAKSRELAEIRLVRCSASHSHRSFSTCSDAGGAGLKPQCYLESADFEGFFSGDKMIIDSFKLNGKVALVTGATAGLGAAIAVALAEAGADVAAHGESSAPDATCELIERTGRRALPVFGNLTDKALLEQLISKTLAHFGQLDILINNAGTIRRAPAVDYSEEDWATVIEVNLSSVFRLSQLAGRHMIERGSGKIVNIASLLAFQGGVTVPAYAASKGGVAQLTKALANEWAEQGINVNAIAPGYMRTDNTAALQADETRSRQILERIPAGRWGEPRDLAGPAVFLSSAASDYLHGHILIVDGGWMGR